jgi:hypothetical protein
LGERLRATAGSTTSSYDEFPSDDFYPSVDDLLLGNLNMGDRTDDDVGAAVLLLLKLQSM